MFTAPRRAATIAVVREAQVSPGIEIMMMKRGPDDRFLPSFYVFPGGAIDRQDSFSAGFHGAAPDYFPGDETRNHELLTHINGAVREAFEESGLLFAYNTGGKSPVTDDAVVHTRFNEYRFRIINQEITFSSFLENEGLVPAYDRIFYLERHITPVFSPIRYDARFFVAVCPGNQRISHDGEELVDTVWLSPDDALSNQRNGKMKMVSPTVSAIKFLRDFSTLNELTGHFTSPHENPHLKSF